MVGKLRSLWVLAALASWPWVVRGQGPSSALPPAPVPVLIAGPAAEVPVSPAPPLTLPPPPPLLPSLPPPPPINPYQDNNGPLLRGDPLLDRPQSPPPGWFAAVDISLVGPHVKDRLQSPVTLNGSADLVHLGGAALDWTGSPRVELGYRLPEGWGEFLIAFRFLVTEGTDTLPGFDLDGGDVPRRSRLNMNVLDIDYGSREYSLGPRWDLKWRAGLRLASVYFDSLADGFFREERTSNNFYGAGAHVGLDLWRTFERYPELSLFTRVEGASVVGQVRQAFEEVIVNEDNSFSGDARVVHQTQAVPVLAVQTGLGYTRCWPGHWSRYAVGYVFENWWYVGETADSRGEVTTQGVFVRAEFGF